MKTPLQELLEYESDLTNMFDSDARVAMALLYYIRMNRKKMLSEEQLYKNVNRVEVQLQDNNQTLKMKQKELLIKIMQSDEELGLYQEHQCKYIKRIGESCTLNNNCKYPNCK